MPPKRSGYVSGGPVAAGAIGTADKLPEHLDVRVLNYAGPTTSQRFYVLLATGHAGKLPPEYARGRWQAKTRRKDAEQGGVGWNDLFHNVRVKGTHLRVCIKEGECKDIPSERVVGFVDIPLTDVCRDIGKVLDTNPGAPLKGCAGSIRIRVLAKGGAIEEAVAAAQKSPWSQAVPGARTQADLDAAIAASEKTFKDEQEARKALLATMDEHERAEYEAAEGQSKEKWEKELKAQEDERNKFEAVYTVDDELAKRKDQREKLDVFRQTRMTMTLAKMNATKVDLCDHASKERELDLANEEAAKAAKAAAAAKAAEEAAAKKRAEEAEAARIKKLQELLAAKEQAIRDILNERDQAQKDLLRVEDEALEATAQVAILGTQSRAVHNELEDLRGKIRVFCRTRPEKSGEAGGVLEFPAGDSRSVVLREGDGIRAKTFDFLFDRAFPGDTAQEEVFNETKGYIKSAIDGVNTCIFAYGQTGSGKTHTLVGSPNDPGIARRAMRTFFDPAQTKLGGGEKLIVECSMVELYIDTFFDLLGTARKPLKLKAGGAGPADIEGRTWSPATSYEGMVALFAKGEGARSVRCTSMNERSSRSHLIFIIRATTQDSAGKKIRSGQYALVDLAGCERLKKSGVDNQGLREAVAINKSLSALGNVIQALSKGGRHIPYRDHELTKAMESFMTGDSKMLMFVNVSPAKSSFGESKGALTFAQRTKTVQLASEEHLQKNKAAIDAKTKELAGLMGKLSEQTKLAGEKEIERQDLNEQLDQLEEMMEEEEEAKEDLERQLKKK